MKNCAFKFTKSSYNPVVTIFVFNRILHLSCVRGVSPKPRPGCVADSTKRFLIIYFQKIICTFTSLAEFRWFSLKQRLNHSHILNTFHQFRSSKFRQLHYSSLSHGTVHTTISLSSAILAKVGFCQASIFGKVYDKVGRGVDRGVLGG